MAIAGWRLECFRAAVPNHVARQLFVVRDTAEDMIAPAVMQLSAATSRAVGRVKERQPKLPQERYQKHGVPKAVAWDIGAHRDKGQRGLSVEDAREVGQVFRVLIKAELVESLALPRAAVLLDAPMCTVRREAEDELVLPLVGWAFGRDRGCSKRGRRSRKRFM